ncbi:site-specific DNA-methyltransferase [Sphingosinicella sp. BN140058]|uniref:DNA-methyltransferase n=1 Tax=Sphingosinicella sp. BN140058 TaxID=1892855 RepID=UPI00101221F4|nr:site-specific DNA-methyltransferase [Sphingosinicella sp. BN140058]QAY80339.1 site-specific DNA-methyltransferase [Sphingosinicella sp. BN140058]
MITNASASLSAIERAVLADLQTMTYDEVRAKHGWSRGKIYALACREGARKTEAKIRERAADRKARQQEFLAEMIDQTATADVLDYLDSMPDGCAQLVCTSPPYNVGKKYGEGAGADTMRHVYYLGWLMQIVSEAARVLADGGVLFLQVGSTRDEHDHLMPLDIAVYDFIRKTGLTFQNRVIWTIPHGLTPRRRLAERHETVLIFCKGDRPRHFHANPLRIPQKDPGKRAFKGPNKGELSGHPLGAWPSNVWAIPNVGHNAPERTGHPAQMPSELVRRAIHLYTVPGDLVIDPFSGSGTTHATCVETARRFSGCDLFYGDLRAKRLAATKLAAVCPLPGVTPESIAVWQAETVRVDHDPSLQLDFLAVA